MIEVYTRDNCQYCESAKELLKIEGTDYKEYNLSKGDVSRGEVFARLGKTEDERITLPVVFIDDNYIGGYEQLGEYFASLAIERQDNR